MQEISNKIHFPELEKEILQFWRDEQIFQKSIDQRPEDRPFIFYDGPPFATGLPHYGHLLAGTIKDVIPRYKTMRNFRVERRFGWDTHGLPVEYEVEQDLKLNGAEEIREYGVGKFNEASLNFPTPYSRISSAPFSLRSCSTSYSTGNPWVSQPKRRSTRKFRIVL